ncbi:MAG: ATP-binding protein, partial [Polyangiales bacterium]
VEGDDGKLVQVFTNLLMNAAQAIGDGAADANEIHIRTFTNAVGQAVIEIRDSGPGIAAEILPKVFDPFFTTKPVGAGSGLGLAICHSIITSLGGHIVVESAGGKGALFRVTLPPVRPSRSIPPQASALTPLPPATTTRRGKVLVIDDEVDVARAIARMLRSLHDVSIETDGREALSKIAAGSAYDIVFCDMMMPNLSGIQFYEALLAAAPEQARRVVFMTGGAFSPRSQEFLDAVGNVQISKPFSIDTVRSLARDYSK